MEKKYEPIERNLTKRGFHFSYFDTPEQGISFILSLIPPKSSIGFGGSITVKESGLLDALVQSNRYTLFHREICSDTQPDILYKKIHQADWFITSTNALTESGEFVNIDGRGNRVAAMLNGPKNVIILLGVNKLVKDIAAGIDRTRNVASPLNARRLNRKLPCALLNKCTDCNSPDKMCNATVILHHPTSGSTVYVVLINKNLGY